MHACMHVRVCVCIWG